MKYLRRYDTEELTSLETEYSTLPTKFITYSSNFQKSTLVRNKRYIPAEYVEMKRGKENYIKTRYRANKDTNVRIVFESTNDNLDSWGWIFAGGTFNCLLNLSLTDATLAVSSTTKTYNSPYYTDLATASSLGITSSNRTEKLPQEILHRKFDLTINNRSIILHRYNLQGTAIDRTWTATNSLTWNNEADYQNAISQSTEMTPYATIYLFVCHRWHNPNSDDGGSSIYGYARDARIYYFKAWEGTETMREYIPIYDIVDKKYGFHETVSDTYTFGATSALFEGSTKINDYVEK